MHQPHLVVHCVAHFLGGQARRALVLICGAAPAAVGEPLVWRLGPACLGGMCAQRALLSQPPRPLPHQRSPEHG